MPALIRLTDDTLDRAYDDLARIDRDLKRILDDHGKPVIRWRKGGFGTLVFLIMEQQVSVASAEAMHRKLIAATGGITPDSVMALGDEGLRGAGLSRQKARYVRILAEEVSCGGLKLGGLPRKHDDDVRAELTRLTGIGDWTADIYLLSSLRRPDIWPAKDLAVAIAAGEIKGMDRKPTLDELEEIAEPWRPWRAVAARLLWHYYRHAKGFKGKSALP